MAITDQKIGAWTSPVVNEADQPQRTAADMKAVFDSNSNQIKAKYNALIDALAGTGGADNIGSEAIGDLQAGTVATQLSALLAKFAGYPASSDIKGIRLNSEGRIEVTLDGTQWQLTAQTGDPALDLGALETAQTIDDADGFLMYDASEMKNKRTLWSKIKSVLGNAYAPATHSHGDITSDGKYAVPISGEATILWCDTDGSIFPRANVETLNALGAQAKVSRLTPAGGTAALTLADNTEYRFSSSVTSLTLTFPSGDFDCWMRFTTGSSGATVNFPSGTQYIGGAPTFETGKTYEMSIKNSVVVCAEVVSE